MALLAEKVVQERVACRAGRLRCSWRRRGLESVDTCRYAITTDVRRIAAVMLPAFSDWKALWLFFLVVLVLVVRGCGSIYGTELLHAASIPFALLLCQESLSLVLLFRLDDGRHRGGGAKEVRVARIDIRALNRNQ